MDHPGPSKTSPFSLGALIAGAREAMILCLESGITMCDGLKCCGGQIWRICQCGTSIVARQVYPGAQQSDSRQQFGYTSNTSQLDMHSFHLACWYISHSSGRNTAGDTSPGCLIHGGRCPKRHQGHPQAEDISWKSLDLTKSDQKRQHRDRLLHQSLCIYISLYIYTHIYIYIVVDKHLEHQTFQNFKART